MEKDQVQNCAPGKIHPSHIRPWNCVIYQSFAVLTGKLPAFRHLSLPSFVRPSGVLFLSYAVLSPFWIAHSLCQSIIAGRDMFGPAIGVFVAN